MSEGRLKIVDAWVMPAPKTKAAMTTLSALGATAALVVDVENEMLKLSIRNLPRAKFLRTDGLNVADLMRFESVVMTTAAARAIDGVLKS